MAPNLLLRFAASVITIYLLLPDFTWSQSESWVSSYGSSVPMLEKLATSDLKIARLFYRRREKLPPSSYIRSQVNQFLEDFEDGTGLRDQVLNWKEWAANLTKKDIKKLSKKIVWSPLSAFKLINRQYSNMRDLNESAADYFDLSSLVLEPPVTEDVKALAEGLLRIQQIHDLNTRDMAEGLVAFNVSTGVKLSARDCYLIGDYGRDLEFWALSIEWLNLSMSMSRQEWPDLSTDKLLKISAAFGSPFQKTQKELLQAAKTHDDLFFRNTTLENDRFFTRPLYLTPENVTHLPQLVRRRSEMVREHEGRWHYKVATWALCQGQNWQTEKEKSGLFCWLESRVHPSFYIGPLKVEVLSKRPVILQFYDVIGPKLRKKLQSFHLANSSLSIIKVDKPTYSIPVFKEDRSQMPDDFKPGPRVFTPLFMRFEATQLDEYNETIGLPTYIRNIETMTGLVLRGSKDDRLPYYTYNFAGQLDPHIDKGSEDAEGMRIATFMTYMNNVEVGGETVFPFAGISVKPVKGAALFWFSTYRNGLELDDFALHAACPPIIGAKTISTRWILNNYQFENWKCPLGQKQMYDWNFFKQKYKSLDPKS